MAKGSPNRSRKSTSPRQPVVSLTDLAVTCKNHGQPRGLEG